MKFYKVIFGLLVIVMYSVSFNPFMQKKTRSWERSVPTAKEARPV